MMEAEENFIRKRVTYHNNVSWMILKLAGKTLSENWDTFGNCHSRCTQKFHGQFTLETASSFSLAKSAYTLLKHLFIYKCARLTCLLLPVFVCCRLSDLYPLDPLGNLWALPLDSYLTLSLLQWPAVWVAESTKTPRQQTAPLCIQHSQLPVPESAKHPTLKPFLQNTQLPAFAVGRVLLWPRTSSYCTPGALLLLERRWRWLPQL